MKSLAGEFVYGYHPTNPMLLSKMTGPAHSIETTYEPHRDLITGVTNTVAAGILLCGPVPAGVPPVGSRPTNSPNPAPAAGPELRTASQAPRTISSYSYSNDILGRRETISQGSEAFAMLTLGENKVDVAYNDRSEVTGAVYKTGNDIGQNFRYAYDDIGNRLFFRPFQGSKIIDYQDSPAIFSPNREKTEPHGRRSPRAPITWLLYLDSRRNRSH